jgi:hypothetical protein
MLRVVCEQYLLTFFFLLNISVYLVLVLLNQTLFKVILLNNTLLVKKFIILAILRSK